jgi:diaminohydroxyphosphoribosylaminopyrimidine deaminase/5-amino-6-(5-phosphoribosylamino)uracil reductase
MNARVNFPVNQAKKILLSKKDYISRDFKFFKEADVEILKERDIHKIVSHVQRSSINSILVEAGPKLVNAFLISGLIDELIIYKSPNHLGDNGVSWFDKETAVENFGFTLESTYKIESDTKQIYKKC